jgi:hypothetical protein
MAQQGQGLQLGELNRQTVALTLAVADAHPTV